MIKLNRYDELQNIVDNEDLEYHYMKYFNARKMIGIIKLNTFSVDILIIQHIVNK